MLLTPTRLGSYELLSPLGAGGMGEVYRARDSRLGREVAIKVLPPEVSADRDRLARFEREARAASALNHPNIVTIYDVGSADSISYISMELVQGTTLRELLAAGALPLKRLLALSVQIADGLARAHEAGIIHRDLKPENVMVTREGLVKILDFGLAKLVESSGPELSQLTTMATPTEPGVALGTAGYMSPEQAAGRPADFASDQFSLGSILYEMATGKRAFARGTAAETMTAIMREEPEPIGRLAPQIPAALRWIIGSCLSKDAHDRYVSTRDLARDLARLRDHVSEISQEPSAAQPRRRPGWLWPAATATLALAAAAIFIGPRWRREPALQTLRFSIPNPPGATNQRPVVAISPDGTRLAIEAVHEGRTRIYLRALDSDKTVEVEGTLGAAASFWSPDSRFLAFYSGGKLKKVAIAGGPPMDLCTATLTGPGTWSPNGTILYPQTGRAGGLFRVSDRGGEPIRVTTVAPSEDNHFRPCFLPDGRRFIYFVNMPWSGPASELRLGSLDSKDSRVVAQLDSRAEYVAPGYLAYVREGTLIVQPFDARSGRLRGEPHPIVNDVSYYMSNGTAGFSFSQSRVLVYTTAAPISLVQWLSRDGRVIGPLGPPSVIGTFRISPDGSRVAVSVTERRTGTGDIWLFDRGRGIPTRLHSDPISEDYPVWLPDGATLAYGSERKGPPDILAMATSGGQGVERVLLEGPVVEYPQDFSRDGHYLAYISTSQWNNWDIGLLPLEGSGSPVPWLQTPSNESNPRFSPDGRWIAYQSDESGTSEIYVARTDAAADKQRLSPAGGQKPRWRADGRELYYIGPAGLVMAVRVSTGAAFTSGDPVPLFQVEDIEDVDVTADGSRFLVSAPAERSQESRIRVIVNWTSLLRGER